MRGRQPSFAGDKTHRLTPDDLGLPPEQRPPRAEVCLLIYHPDGAHIAPLHPDTSIVVGRTPPSEVAIADVSLSRQHARFALVKGEVWVEDLGSTNGTLLRGAPVDKARLELGEEIRLGTVIVTVHELSFDRPTSSRDLCSHERFRAALEAEVARARFFGRHVSVLFVKPRSGDERHQRPIADQRPQHTHVRFWLPRLQALLRSVDRVGLYSHDTLEILLPEGARELAVRLANDIVRALRTELGVSIGVATFPEPAFSAEELLGEAHAAWQRATADEPVQAASERRRSSGPQLDAGALPPIAESAAMRKALETASRAAKSAIPVVLQGETGTGKEILARFIHEMGPRRARPLLCVNCGAVAPSLLETTLFGHEKGAFTGADAQHKGVFEAADGGTVFLDEVGELTPSAQVALLRVLETKRFARVGSTKELTVDVRVVAATHCDLEQMVAEKRFRQDLFFRLNALVLRLPPLRERPEDVPAFVARFLDEASRDGEGVVRSIDQAALDVLRGYAWPGNVRELKNAIDRAVVIAAGDTLTVDDLPERVRMTAPTPRLVVAEPLPAAARSPMREAIASLEGDFRTRVELLEAEVLRHALEEACWNQTEAARQLGMPRRTLVHKIKMHGLAKPR